MKFIQFGSPIFARLVLEQLVESDMLPMAVVCNPDRPSGRKQELTPPEIKRYILEKKLPIEILQPESPSDIAEYLKSLEPDFFVISAYGKILKSDVLSVPPLGSIGVHSSLLPKYRGTTPIQSAILAGEKETGATLYMVDEKMDHGPILARAIVPIEETDTHETIFPKIWSNGGKKLTEIIPDFLSGKLKPEPQDEFQATFTKKFTGDEGMIAFEDLDLALTGDAEKSIIISRKIRALNPDPGAWTLTQKELHLGRATVPIGKRLMLLAVELNGDKLVLKKIQVEGKNPINL